MIKKHVKKKLEERLIRDKEKAVINMIGGNPKATPAQSEDSPNPKAKPKAKPKATPAAPKTKPKGGEKEESTATPVYPAAAPKAHNRPKGNNRERSQSPGPDNRKKMYCMFHFEKKNCKKGKDCPYSHSQKVYDAKKKDKKDGSRSNSSSRSRKPRGRSESPAPLDKSGNRTCLLFAKGKCTYGDKCKFSHEPAAPAKPKAKATPATADPFFYSDDEDEPFEVGAVKIGELKSFNVVFAGDVDITEIEMEDYGNKPKSHRKDPNRPIKKISTESLTDEQTRVENSLANVRARARAIIMDQSDDYKDVLDR
eukprot:s2232_g2.t1